MLFSGCGGKHQPPPGGAGALFDLLPATALRTAQIALESAGGYRLRVEQSNFVLPRWGGVDGGVVEVNRDGSVARADLARTGETGATYTITLVGGQTYFQRSTCSETFRVPGGTAEVLSPFLFAKTKTLANAHDARWSGTTLQATVDGLGPVSIELDMKTGRPISIRGTSNNQDLVWHFESWGTNPRVSAPAGPVQDRGPGGVPC